ncbi:DEAD/DEAH box helicase [Pseudomonas fluorescens]|uniref:DEAD/DEAH box helicase n=1 Tax=Pseudomonas fluorescens TaxID=294 RepID=UPI001A9E7914|nr:DEAD/DEAH box helicase family protein [Pseudomonas fluorescens]QTD31250.1 DEAD/DEAH box helicase family protein [Pseudomonas fluorescens]
MTVNNTAPKTGLIALNGLRECQKKSIEVALAYSKTTFAPTNSKSCLISLPTGAGKSGVIAITAHASRQKRILILCHRRAVCDQLIEQVAGNFFKVVTCEYEKPIKPVYDNIENVDLNGIYISTFQKLIKLKPEQLDEIKNNIDLIIVDEGHSEPSPIWRTLVRETGAHKIIFTATPYRNDLFQFDIDENHSYIYTFEEALESNILTNPDFCTTKSDEELKKSIKLFLSDNPNTKCIVKCADFKSIESYYKLLNNDFQIIAIHEQYEKDPRSNVKARTPKQLRSTPHQVIIHQHKLDEGIDIPEAKLLVLTYTVNSGRELVQSVGRVVRKYKNHKPLILENKINANARIWKNYRDFDKSLKSEAATRKFIESLNTNKLIETYLQSFPDISYYNKNFLRKFDITKFNPKESLIIPTASICFINTLDEFDVHAATELLCSRSNQAGELAEKFSFDNGMIVIASIVFGKSKFLTDQFFFEPSLEITTFKKLENDILAIFDSRGRRFNNDTEMCTGSPLSIDKLLKVTTLGKTNKTKETSSKSISTAKRRPERVSIKGDDLEQMASLQRNSSYRVSTLKCDNIDDKLKTHSSYYIGIDSGRISDQKDGEFTLDGLNQWLDSMAKNFTTTKTVTSTLLHSYAKPIPANIKLKIESVIFDFSDFTKPIDITINGEEIKLGNTFLYLKNDKGLTLDQTKPHIKLKISITDKEPFIAFHADHQILYKNSADGSYSDVSSFLLKHLHKALLENGVSYAAGKFYEVKLPTESKFQIAFSSLENTIIGMPDLLNPKLDEKGYEQTILKPAKKTLVVNGKEFNTNSVFHLVDLIKNNALPNPTSKDLGPFRNHIAGADLVFCTDMATEPADFILSSPEKLVYVHIKCGNKSAPRSSAGALAEVGGQAIKNIEMLISGNLNLKSGNSTHLKKSWPTENAPQRITERLRLLHGNFVTHKDQKSRDQAVKEAWDVIANRRRSSRVKKEAWIIAANSFSLEDFEIQLNKGHKARPESLQAYQLIQSWISTANDNDVELKIFVSKKP